MKSFHGRCTTDKQIHLKLTNPPLEALDSLAPGAKLAWGAKLLGLALAKPKSLFFSPG